MGIILQIIGVLSALAALVVGIISIATGSFHDWSLVFLFVGIFLIRLGRKIYNDKR